MDIGVLLEGDQGGMQELGVVADRGGGGVDDDGVVGGCVGAGGTTRTAKPVGIVVNAAGPMLDSKVVAG